MTTAPHFDYAIIGQGAAGLAAAEAIRAEDSHSQIAIVSDEDHPYYSRPGLAYVLNGQVPEKQLFPRSKEDVAAIGAIHLHKRAIDLDPTNHQFAFDDGSSLSYRVALLATGAGAVLPDVPGIDLDGVVTLDTLDDARQILKKARKARRAIVVGGGITALELAEGLAARGVETHYLLRRDRYWSNVLDEAESKMVETRLIEEGIHLHHRTNLVRIIEHRGRVAGVELDPTGVLDCQIVAVAIGIRPRLALAQAAGLDTDRGILVDPHMRTSQADLYAAGDVAQVYDPVVGEHVLDSLWWLAREQGRIAGANMTGGEVPYQRSLPFNVTRIGGLTTTIIGALGQGRDDEDLVSIARGDSQTWRHRPDAFAVEADAESNRLRLIVGARSILGALVMGDQTLSRPLMSLVREEIDIRPIREQLLAGQTDLSQLILDFMQKQAGSGHAIQT
ncbi:MAG: FAD-dependent oxidoreductase [Anaerolineales bacterium]|jgi:NADPH-dependent 2,4-dienoyl-CoA reductase/sulfur reductase-like enzyme